jgi:predicted ArsR family transcriptional regulator
MGIILAALQQHEKSTAAELAKLCAVEPRQAIATLLRLESTGCVWQRNGFWHFCTHSNPRPPRRSGDIAKVSLPALVKLVEERGPTTARELADEINASRKAVSTALCNAFREGRLSRSGNRSAYVYAKKLTL